MIFLAVETLDNFACNQLTKLETNYPIIGKPTDKVFILNLHFLFQKDEKIYDALCKTPRKLWCNFFLLKSTKGGRGSAGRDDSYIVQTSIKVHVYIYAKNILVIVRDFARSFCYILGTDRVQILSDLLKSKEFSQMRGKKL